MSNLESVEKKARALIRAAATDPTRWSEVVSQLAAAIGCSGAHIFTPSPDPASRYLSVQWGALRDTQFEYLTNWAQQDPWFLRARERGRFYTGMACSGRELLSDAELKETAFYNEFGHRAGAGQLLPMVISDGCDGNAPMTVLSFSRGELRAPFEIDHQALLQALWPDFSRALLGYWSLRKAQAFDSIAERALDALPQPAWILREDLAIDYQNRAALELAARKAVVRSHAGRLRFIGDADLGAVAVGARNAFAPGSMPAHFTADAGERVHATVRWNPVAPESPYALAWPFARLLLTLEVPQPVDPLQHRLSTLSRLARLTPAELRVLELLVGGSDAEEIEHRLDITRSTLRTHRQALFGKTGCRRQVDLIRLVLGIGG